MIHYYFQYLNRTVSLKNLHDNTKKENQKFYITIQGKTTLKKHIIIL